MNRLLELYLLFWKLGSVTFGGGYAMLPLLQRELVEKRGWVTDEEMLDYFAIGQSTPGVIAVNVATFVGYKRCGVIGGIAATLGMVTSPLIIITIIAAFIRNFAEIELVQHALNGLTVGVSALIIQAVYKMLRGAVIDLPTLIVYLVTLAMVFFTAVSPVYFVLAGGVIGLVLGMYQKKGAGK